MGVIPVAGSILGGLGINSGKIFSVEGRVGDVTLEDIYLNMTDDYVVGGNVEFSQSLKIAVGLIDNDTLSAILLADPSATSLEVGSSLLGAIKVLSDDKADDSEVVKLSGNQSIDGVKQFIKRIDCEEISLNSGVNIFLNRLLSQAGSDLIIQESFSVGKVDIRRPVISLTAEDLTVVDSARFGLGIRDDYVTTEIPIGGVADTSLSTTKQSLVGAINELQAKYVAVESGYSRRKKVINIVDNTQVPPTENAGDRYILDFTIGGVNAAWDGAAAGDIVEFDGADWQAKTPVEGWTTYVDSQDKDALYYDDGTPTWELRVVSASLDHNDATNIQGGSPTERFHQTSAQHTISTQAATISLDGYLKKEDWATFNSKADGKGINNIIDVPGTGSSQPSLTQEGAIFQFSSASGSAVFELPLDSTTDFAVGTFFEVRKTNDVLTLTIERESGVVLKSALSADDDVEVDGSLGFAVVVEKIAVDTWLASGSVVAP